MDYEWDETKREANRIKHGVDFAIAADFDWNHATHELDDRCDYNEVRMVSCAPIKQRIYAMVWTARDDRVRIIGLRKANPREVARHESKT